MDLSPARNRGTSLRRSLSGITRVGLLLALCLLLLPSGVTLPAAPAPHSPAPAALASSALTVRERYGIASSHLACYDAQVMEKEFQALQELQACWVRCTFAWHDLEWQGNDIWTLGSADRAVQEADQRGIRVLGILGGCPSWANGGKEPTYPPTPQNLVHWADYVRTVSARYRGKVAAWEIWNEENIQFWQPQPDPVYYVQLLAIAYEEIRQADPQAKVVMGGMAGVGADFLIEAFEAGALNYVDAVAYHPYADTIGEETDPPEALQWPKEVLSRNLVLAVRDLIWQYEKNRPIELWITELGWSASDSHPTPVDTETQAAYLMRAMINYASTNLDRFIVYSLRDDRDEVKDWCGLMKYDFTPKPSYHYYRTFMEVFGEATSEDAAAVSFSCSRPSTLEAHCFPLPDGSLALAAWKSDNQPDTLSLTVQDPAFSTLAFIDPSSGQRTAAAVSRDAWGRLQLSGVSIGKNPVIMRVGRLRVTSVEPDRAMQNTIWLNLSVEGSGFQEGAQVRLVKGGTTIEAFNVNVVSPQQLTAVAGLFLAEPGSYDLVVTNPDGEEARAEGIFTVTAMCGLGGGAAVLFLGFMLGLATATGYLRRKRPR